MRAPGARSSYNAPEARETIQAITAALTTAGFSPLAQSLTAFLECGPAYDLTQMANLLRREILAAERNRLKARGQARAAARLAVALKAAAE